MSLNEQLRRLERTAAATTGRDDALCVGGGIGDPSESLAAATFPPFAIPEHDDTLRRLAIDAEAQAIVERAIAGDRDASQFLLDAYAERPIDSAPVGIPGAWRSWQAAHAFGESEARP